MYRVKEMIDSYLRSISHKPTFVWQIFYIEQSSIPAKSTVRQYSMRFLHHIVLLSLILLAQKDTSAQSVLWAKDIGGTSQEEPGDLALDLNGNVYTAGFFNGTVDFDPGPNSFNLTALGTGEAFISKLDASGNFVGQNVLPEIQLRHQYLLTRQATFIPPVILAAPSISIPGVRHLT